MNLVIDIGNTHTKIAGFEHGRISEIVRIDNKDHSDALTWITKRAFNKAIYCSVGGVSLDIINVITSRCPYVIRLDKDTSIPFDVLYKSVETLGYDRIAAVSGAYKAFPGENVLIFDFGTAITIDFLSAEGEYRGGNISPGLKIRYNSLHDYTSALPQMEKTEQYLLFGDDTPSAITAGVQRGVMYEISGYLHDFEQLYPACKFVATGGDAAFVASGLKHPVIVNQALVLEGLDYILEYNTTSNEKR